MSEHTKGKWEVMPDGLTIRAKIEYKPHYDAVSPQTLIAKCFQNGHLGHSIRPTEEDKANARLIAAAPQLLAACEFVATNTPVSALGKGYNMLVEAIAAGKKGD